MPRPCRHLQASRYHTWQSSNSSRIKENLNIKTIKQKQQYIHMWIVCYDTGKRNITLINQVFREVHSLNKSRKASYSSKCTATTKPLRGSRVNGNFIVVLINPDAFVILAHQTLVKCTRCNERTYIDFYRRRPIIRRCCGCSVVMKKMWLYCPLKRQQYCFHHFR